MKPINKYVIDVNEYLNKQFQFFAHLKEDNITKEIKKETLNDHTVLCIKYFEKMVRTKSLEKVFRNFKEVFFEKLSPKAEVLLNEIVVKDIIFEDSASANSDNNSKSKDITEKCFEGIHEGKTKFFRKAIRGGQIINFPGNIVIIGDVNHGSEVYAGFNLIVVGAIKGKVFAGIDGNRDAIIAAFHMQPEILKIADIITMSPDSEKPKYPEVAKIKDNSILVEPYLNNKYI